MEEVLLWVIIIGLIICLSFYSFKQSFGCKSDCSAFHDYMSIPTILIIMLVMFILMIPAMIGSCFGGKQNDEK